MPSQFIKFFASILILVISTLILSACGPIYSTTYTYEPPQEWRGRKCVNRCLEDKSYCKVQDERLNRDCRRDEQLAAVPAYIFYVSEQKKLGKPIDRSQDSFANYSNCRTNSGCENNYNQCYSNCGGHVITNRVCTAFCN